jgi:hypothetical protein
MRENQEAANFRFLSENLQVIQWKIALQESTLAVWTTLDLCHYFTGFDRGLYSFPPRKGIDL